MITRLQINAITLLFITSLFFSACKDKHTSAKEVEPKPVKQTNEENISTEKPKKNILCFGNSLTAGYGLDEKEAWPHLLQLKLDSLGKDYTVINAGLSGETTSGGLNRIDWVLKQKVDVFILELGANDMLRGLDVVKSLENLDLILEKVKSKYKDVEIILAGMLSPPNMGADYEEKFNKIFPDLAKKYDALLIPFFLKDVAGINDLNLPDRKHPNAEGQKIVLQNVWLQLKKVI